MNILSDPCCIGAIAVVVIYGIVQFVSLIVRKYRPRSLTGSHSESTHD
jgi:hypothetical protein